MRGIAFSKRIVPRRRSWSQRDLFTGKILRDTWDKLIYDDTVEMTGVVISHEDWTRLRAEPNDDQSLTLYSLGEGPSTFRYLPIEIKSGDFQPQILTRSA